MQVAPHHGSEIVVRGRPEGALNELQLWGGKSQFPRGALIELRGKHSSLPVSEGTDRLGLGDLELRKELPAPRASPTPLTCQQVSQCPCGCLPGRDQDDVSGRYFTVGDAPLQLRTREPDLVGPLQRTHPLRLWGHHGGFRHVRFSLPASCPPAGGLWVSRMRTDTPRDGSRVRVYI